MPYYYSWGFNYYYLIFMLPGLALTIWAQYKISSTYKRYNQVRTLQGITGADIARRILDMNGLYQVKLERVNGTLSDHYDPRANVVRLSAATFDGMSIAAVGIAAHECGHAVQHAKNYTPARIRSSIVPVANIGSSLSVPMIIVGIILNFTGLIYFGIILFSLAVLFQLVTLPVELNASSRAISTLDGMGLFSQEEISGVTKVLTAAAFTYIAALLTSVLQLLYYITIAGNRRGRR